MERQWFLLERLELMPYVRRLELADATAYQIKDKDIAIILSETMNLALFKEPYVSIMLNLGPQLGEEVIYIPQEVMVTVCKQGSANSLKQIKRLLQFDGQYIMDKVKTSDHWEFEKTGVEIDLKTNERLSYLTEITIYKEFKLGLNDSSLTLLKPIKTFEKTGKLQLDFQYQVSENPGFLLI